jgi:hypothetical protein
LTPVGLGTPSTSTRGADHLGLGPRIAETEEGTYANDRGVVLRPCYRKEGITGEDAMTDQPDSDITEAPVVGAGPTPTAREVSFYLRLVSWICWIVAAFSFFAIAGGLVLSTVAWTESAMGLIVFGFVIRHVPSDVREIAGAATGDIYRSLRLLSWVCWVVAAFSFFAIAGGLVTLTTAWSSTAFGLFAIGFVFRHMREP